MIFLKGLQPALGDFRYLTDLSQLQDGMGWKGPVRIM